MCYNTTEQFILSEYERRNDNNDRCVRTQKNNCVGNKRKRRSQNNIEMSTINKKYSAENG